MKIKTVYTIIIALFLICNFLVVIAQKQNVSGNGNVISNALSVSDSESVIYVSESYDEIKLIQDKFVKVDKVIGEKQVVYYEHFIDDIQIKNNSILIHKDKNTGEIINYRKSWVNTADILIENKNIDFSLVDIDNYYWKQKVCFVEEKDCMNFYKFNKPVNFPVLCLEVRFKDGRTILYDKEGIEIGNGIQAPVEGFLMTGPHEGNDVWNHLRSNAEGYYSQWCNSITSVFNPYPSTGISPRVSDPNVELFYEVAHGGSTYFEAHNTVRYYSSTSSKDNVKADMNYRQPMKFAFIGSCEGMTDTGEGKFSYEFRKGQMENTVTVGYTGMGDDDGWPKARPWQDHMFDKMNQGYTIKNSFDSACAEYPTIADAVVFVGDENLMILSGELPPYAPYNPVPIDDSYSIPRNILLSWQGGDPNYGDIVYYDVYMEANDNYPDNKVSNDQTTLTYQTNSLMYNTDYYWRIVARDEHNEITEGPVWHFKTVDNAGDNVDQQQDQFDATILMQEYSGSMATPAYAQSFKPDEAILSSVKLFIQKEGNPGDFSVDVRHDLGGYNLISISKPGGTIPSSLEWVEFDFSDINVNIGSTYFIVVSAEGTDKNNYYMLSIGIDTPYNDGMFFRSKTKDGPWDDGIEENDLTFRTYAYGDSNNDPPNTPVGSSPDDEEFIYMPSFEDVDVNDDGNVDVLDVWIVGNTVIGGVDPGEYDVDIDNDGEIDYIDYSVIKWYLYDEISIGLEIMVSDPNNDQLDVDFYLNGIFIGSHNNVVSEGIALFETDVLIPGNTYSWYVEVDDTINPSVQSKTYSFTIVSPDENNPPDIPSNPIPLDGAIDVSITSTLLWIGGDPDVGDTVSYDVYLGTDFTPELLVSNLYATSYNPGNLEYNTHYYWKIVSRDNHGLETIGDIWDFTTEDELVTYYTLSTSVDEGGYVTPSGGTYEDGTSVTLTAVADSGWVFSHWTGALSGSVNPEDLFMDGDKSVTAVFVEGQVNYMLTVDIEGQGLVTRNPDQAEYGVGSVVTLTAVPDEDYIFYKWSGDDFVDSYSEITTVEMDSDKVITAKFVEKQSDENISVHFDDYSIGCINVDITNNIGEEYTNIKWNLSVTGGFLGGVDESSNGSIELLNGSESVTIGTQPDSIAFRLGIVEIKVSVIVDGIVYFYEADGFVIGRFVLII